MTLSLTPTQIAVLRRARAAPVDVPDPGMTLAEMREMELLAMLGLLAHSDQGGYRLTPPGADCLKRLERAAS